MIPFGPPLIGQTEKALGALLRAVLAPYDLTESQWVALRLTAQFDGESASDSGSALADFIAARGQFPGAGALVAELSDRGLIAGCKLSPAGAAAAATIGRRIAETTAPLWTGFEDEDLATTERVLNTVLERTRALLHPPTEA